MKMSPQLASQDMVRRITSGEWPLGSLLAVEAELGKQYRLTRYGVRQAVQKLCDLGLVDRQQGIGTRVVSNVASSRYVQSVLSLDDIVQYVKGTRLMVSSRRRLSAASVLRDFEQLQGHGFLEAHQPDEWLRVDGVRYAQARELPVALAQIYINGQYGDLPELTKTVTMPIYSLIEQRYKVKVTRVEQEIFGVRILGEAAERLRVREGDPGLRVVRKYLVGDQIVDVTVGTHPAERFSYSMSFELAPGGAYDSRAAGPVATRAVEGRSERAGSPRT